MAMSPDQPPDILERLEDYAVEAIGLFRYLQEQSDRAGWDLGRQFLRAATSIGANVEEAQAASSRKDFIYKYSIAQREARECRFFLRLFIRVDLAPEEQLRPLLQEANELYAIITTIIKNAKRTR
ncbi:MAG: four helix bundle protein [Bacteroidetes bacterium]|nr:four helix bundle protein [Bacteroidota bacterium]